MLSFCFSFPFAFQYLSFIVRPEINVPQGAFAIRNNHRTPLKGMVVRRGARTVGRVACTPKDLSQ